jgi:hypothetical protein
MSDEKKYVDGLFIKTRETQYGEIINQSFHTEKFIQYLKENTNEKGYCNIDILTTRDGKKYAKLNDWKPAPQSAPVDDIQSTTKQDNEPDDLPF